MRRASKKSQLQSREYETIEFYLRPAQLRRAKRAAELKGMSVSDFAISSAYAAAVKIIESAGS
jgi:uncharacterized protein (DUF1778 family)